MNWKRLTSILCFTLFFSANVGCSMAGGGQSNSDSRNSGSSSSSSSSSWDYKNEEPVDLEGKTIIFLGSSVTWGDGGWSMCEYLSEYHGCIVKKYAVGGTTLVDNGYNSYVQRMIRAGKEEKFADYFVCQLSTNDATASMPLGEISKSKKIEDFDTSTIIGAMEFIIASAKEYWACPVGFYTGTRYANYRYMEMVDALLQLKQKWRIDVLDLWNDEEMNAVSKEDYAAYMKDPIHPNKDGYINWWGPKFKEFLEYHIR